MVARLRSGDTVQVISGAEKGKRGKVLRIHSKVKGPDGKKRIDSDGGRVVVQGINLRYKHIKRSQKYPQGGRIQKELPITGQLDRRRSFPVFIQHHDADILKNLVPSNATDLIVQYLAHGFSGR